MHHANHFYGHAHIMARYVGLEHPPRIWGYLQHGWNMHDGFAVGTVFAKGYPKFVWSQACSRRGWAAGLRGYEVVGAPWLYLLDLERTTDSPALQPKSGGTASTTGAVTTEPTGTIVYPFHGWEGQQVVGSHADYLAEIRAVEGDVPLTVCLHWNEYDNPKVRREYEDAGVRVITHGQRGYLWQDTDVAFLYRQLHEIRSHRRVVSNRMSSAVLYAAAAGVEVGVYGDPMELESDHAVLGGIGRPRRMWPAMHQESVPAGYAADVALSELGGDTVLRREEVIDVFGWHAEIDVPGPPPPAPVLTPRGRDGRRGRRMRHRADSHRSPADAEPSAATSITTDAGRPAVAVAVSDDDRATMPVDPPTSHVPDDGAQEATVVAGSGTTASLEGSATMSAAETAETAETVGSPAPSDRT